MEHNYFFCEIYHPQNNLNRDNIFGPLAWEAEIRSFKQKQLKYQDARVCAQSKSTKP